MNDRLKYNNLYTLNSKIHLPQFWAITSNYLCADHEWFPLPSFEPSFPSSQNTISILIHVNHLAVHLQPHHRSLPLPQNQLYRISPAPSTLAMTTSTSTSSLPNPYGLCLLGIIDWPGSSR